MGRLRHRPMESGGHRNPLILNESLMNRSQATISVTLELSRRTFSIFAEIFSGRLRAL
jgi:hypothetical protein